jgi:hypothetical protein
LEFVVVVVFVVVDDDDTVTENFTLEQAMKGSRSIAVIFL